MDERFGEHDDRFGGPMRRGRGRGGRSYRSRARRGSRGREPNPRTRLDDDMGDETNTRTEGFKKRFQPYSRGRSHDSGGSVFDRLGTAKASDSKSSAFKRISGAGKPEGASRSSWYKVTVLNGAKDNQDWILRQLSSSIGVQFQSEGAHVLGDKFMFFISNHKAAMELKRLGSIESKHDTLKIWVKESSPPKGRSNTEPQPSFTKQPRERRSDDDVPMKEDVATAIQHVLGTRYNVATGSLDLSNMYNDDMFKQSGTRVSMFDKSVVSVILALIQQYCPNLLSLNLSNNRLQRLDLYSDLQSACPALQSLDLSDNRINFVNELEHVAGLTNLNSLVLANNPVTQKPDFDFVSYSTSVRKLFPALATLDGHKLSSPVKFDLPVLSGSLPSIKPSFSVNPDTQRLVQTFLEEYYSVFDDASRENLLQAYDADAVFSLSVCTEGPRCPGLKEYIGLSRNLRKVFDSGKRLSLCRRGHLDIVQLLRTLPRTVHYRESFIYDCVSSAQGISFVLNGLFREADGRLSGSDPVMQFTRTFVLAQHGTGVNIINDQLMLRGAAQQGLQVHNVQQQLTFGTGLETISAAQIQAIQNLASQTRMNNDFCKKCLEENDWDLNKAITVFTVLQSQQKIPAEAFQ